MDRIYARDYLKEHIVKQFALNTEDVTDIVAAGVASQDDFAERLPGRWFHNSHEAFPEGWTQADQDAANAGV